MTDNEVKKDAAKRIGKGGGKGGYTADDEVAAL